MESLKSSGEQSRYRFFSGDNLAEQFPFDPEKARFERLKVGIAIEMAEMVGSEQDFLELRKNGKITDRVEKEYLRLKKRPVDKIRYREVSEDEMKGLACNARFNLDVSSGEINPVHYRRILGFFSGMEGNDVSRVSKASAQRFEHYESVNGRMYKEFLDKYPTIMDFDKPANEFLEKLKAANKRIAGKGEAYARDMAKFREMMYGEEQVRALEAIKALNAEAKRYAASENATAARPWSKEHRKFNGQDGNGEIEFSGQFYTRGERVGAADPSSAEIYNEVAVDEFKMGPRRGDNLGNGYVNAYKESFEKKEQAYRRMEEEGMLGEPYTTFYYGGRWYIARQKPRG